MYLKIRAFITDHFLLFDIIPLKKPDDPKIIRRKGDNQNRTGDTGVADPCLTAWLCRHMSSAISRKKRLTACGQMRFLRRNYRAKHSIEENAQAFFEISALRFPIIPNPPIKSNPFLKLLHIPLIRLNKPHFEHIVLMPHGFSGKNNFCYPFCRQISI